MVYVDELSDNRLYNRRRGFKYDLSCHLMADSEDELDAFATELSLRRSWRHDDHYDLTANKRQQAVAAGAQEVTSREMVRIRRRKESHVQDQAAL